MGWLYTTLVILLVFAAVVGLMWLGWNRRRRKQAGMPSPQPLPAGLGTPRYAIDDAHYVATSTTGHALERVTVRPLAYRGRAVVEVHETGVAIGITGEQPFFIPTGDIEGVQRTQATIDRAVEKDGLIVIRWQLGGGYSVETFLRVVDPAARQQLLGHLADIYPSSSRQEQE